MELLLAMRVLEVTVEKKLTDALSAVRYGRDIGRGGYRHGHRPRALTRPTGPLAITLRRPGTINATSAGAAGQVRPPP